MRFGRIAATTFLVGALTTTLVALDAGPASAHGTLMKPGARTYLCWQDGLASDHAIRPNNPACAAAVAQGGNSPLYNWFGSGLREGAYGRMRGYIPDGQLCSGGNADFAAYDLARADLPVTHLTSGGSFDWWFSNWAPHPGTFRLYVTRDSWSPTRALTWDDIDETPFLTVTDPPQAGGIANDNGHYYWTARLPSGKSGRHIVYAVWQRSDSQQTFYGCSDVVFDGGTGQVTGVGPGGSTTTTTTRPTTTTTTTRPTTTTTSRATTTTTTTTTPALATTTTTAALTTTTAGGTCRAAFTTTDNWGSGWVGSVTVTANARLTGWRVTLTLPSGTAVTGSWNGVRSGSSGTVTVTNESYNGQLNAGQTTTFGVQGTGSPTGVTATCA
jgi:chitin-binding protein